MLTILELDARSLEVRTDSECVMRVTSILTTDQCWDAMEHGDPWGDVLERLTARRGSGQVKFKKVQGHATRENVQSGAVAE